MLYLRRLWAGGAPYHAWLSFWRHFAAWEGSFLDIGANVGQSVVSFALFNPRMAIWAFEPNPLSAESLAFAAGLVPNEVRIFLCGLADQEATMPLHVPVLRGHQGFGPSSNASLRRHRRVLTVERNNWSEVVEWMRREDYRGFDDAFEDGRGRLTQDAPGRAGKVVDAVLLPRERVGEILAETEALGLRG